MLDALDITEEEARGLSELAAVELAAAKEFSARSLAVGDPKLATELARTAQRHARSFRQTLAMKMRLKREMIRAAAETPETPEPPKPHVPRDGARIKARREELMPALERVVWSEYEWDEPPDPEDDEVSLHFARAYNWILNVSARDNGFGLQPLDDHVVEAARALKLCETAAANWRNLPDPPDRAYVNTGWPLVADKRADTS